MDGDAVGEDWHRKRFEVFGNAEASAIEESHSLGGAIEHLRTTRRDSEGKLFVAASALDDFESVAHQRIVHFNLSDDLLHLQHISAG